jgi:hypothetical protein
MDRDSQNRRQAQEGIARRIDADLLPWSENAELC